MYKSALITTVCVPASAFLTEALKNHEPTKFSLPHNNNNNNNNNNNLLTASGLSPGGSGYFTFKLRQTY
jgi:hypothetical protein